MAREGTSAVAGMSRNAKRSGRQFNQSAPVKVKYFFAAPYSQRLWFSSKNMAARLNKVNKANSFGVSDVAFETEYVIDE